jgi:hypothetical protein
MLSSQASRLSFLTVAQQQKGNTMKRNKPHNETRVARKRYKPHNLARLDLLDKCRKPLYYLLEVRGGRA